MAEQKNFIILRKLLSVIGLSAESIDELVEWIQALLIGDGKGGRKLDDHPYRLRDDFLSQAERSFYLVLRSAVSSWATVCLKVNLGDLFFPTCKDRGEWRAYLNKIDRKHVDFLLCNLSDAKPLMGVELDDRSHNKKSHRQRDQFVDKVFEAAGLPLTRFKARSGYIARDLNDKLRARLGTAETKTPQYEPILAPQSEGPLTNPTCPRCSGEMTLRTVKSGKNKGNQFWGCTNFPKCRGIVPHEPRVRNAPTIKRSNFDFNIKLK